MHRLLSARNFYQNTFHSISLPANISLHTSNPEIECSFCRKILLGRQNSESLFLSRHQSTRTASLLRTVKKRGKHKPYKKYGEVLEVGGQAMNESKVSISKLKAVHLSKLASSTVSLGQLHQLTAKTTKKAILKEVDPELLQSIKEKILKKTPTTTTTSKQISFEDDKCTLVYTNHKISSIEDKIKTSQYLEMVKESYYNFRKATIYDQRLQDLRYAINEGLTQEFDLHSSGNKEFEALGTLPKSPHAVFRELFIDNQLDSYDQALMSQITKLQSQGIAHPAIEDIEEQIDSREDFDFEHLEPPEVKSFNIKKAKQELRQKKKERRDKRRARQELSMKEDMKDVERRGKQESLHRMLAAHLQLLCSLDMAHEGRQILQYYRKRSSRSADNPKITDVKVYNTLLHGYAAKGNLDDTKELLSLMNEDKIDTNAQTFAAVFECVERCSINDKSAVLNYYLELMKEKKISLNDLLDKSKFLYNQREVVSKAIRRIEPLFEPQYTPPNLDYNCPLLDKLMLKYKENRIGLQQSPAEGLMTVEQLIQKGKEQLNIEINGELEITNIDVKDRDATKVEFYRKKLAETQNEWRTAIREAFVRNLGTLKMQSNASHSAVTLYPYFKVLEVDQFVELMMSEVSKLVDGSESYSPTLKMLQRDLGTQIYHKYQIEQYRRNGILEKNEKVYEKFCEWYLSRESVDGTDVPYNGRQAWQAIEHLCREGASLDIEETPWPMETRQNIGKFLYNIIINDVKIDVNMFKPKAKPKKLCGVYRVHRGWGRAVRLELKPHPCLWRLWSGAAPPSLRLRAALLPSAAPPRPWRGVDTTPYSLTPVPLVRLPHNVINQWKRLEEAPSGALYPVLDSLNQLGEVPWVVNKPILDLQLKIFRAGGDKKLDIAPPATSLDPATLLTPGATQSGNTQGDTQELSGAEKYRRRLAAARARADMHSLWCDALYKLSLANHYRDSVFWLPHNMDFRGRVYACPPHLSQLGADTARALLQFAKKEPLGPNGLDWLKLHLINLTGTMKKSTIEERLAYANSIIPSILDSAERPLDGQGWWKASDEPWQTLACCMEIANALKMDDPAAYLSGFPVHQDGSCNGLQHYAALGGDAAGAAAVNLAPAQRPMDVYSAVAHMVEEMRIRDAKAGVPAALVLEGFVRRKVIKQTVMTTVYGVTRFGARLQIAKQLKDIDEFPKEHVWACSQYLTARTFDSLREMFTSTKLIQDWFTDCAKMISGVCGESVEWVTPLGLPVVQPYHRRGAAASAPLDHQQRPCTMKQRNAFPPNFIHSLDSSHMMLTGLHCQARGLAFVSVHDCFWTHPKTTRDMNEICREQFVALHSQPILEDLSEFLVKRYSYNESELEDRSVGAANKKRVNNLLKKVPGKGDFDLKSVLKSVYFFS